MAFASGTKVQVTSAEPHFTVAGNISTNYGMSKLTYEITTPSGYWILTYTWPGGSAQNVNLGEQINAKLNEVSFKDKSEAQTHGSYTLKMTAEDDSGKTISKTLNWSY